MKIQVSFICVFIVITSCKNRKKEYEYYENGKLRVSYEMKDGVKDGTFELYDTNGILQLKCNYINGLREGKTSEYYPNGSLKMEAYYSNGRLDSGYSYSEFGWLSAKNYFDSDENLEMIEIFDANGLRDSSEFIYARVEKTENDRYYFIWRLLNVIPDNVKKSDSGELIITSRLNFNGITRFDDYLTDTIAIVKPRQETHFRFDFDRQEIKGDSLFGVVVFKDMGDKTTELMTYFIAIKIDQ